MKCRKAQGRKKSARKQVRKILHQAALNADIALDYINAHGKRQSIEVHTLTRLLNAMGRHHQSTPSIGDTDTVVPVKVFTQGTHYAFPIPHLTDYHWQLVTEQGEAFKGDSHNVGVDSAHSAATLILPADLPLGYHQLQVNQGDKVWHSRIIIAPARCYEPDALLRSDKLWGACVQLYTLRSEHNWGIGDFGDLHRMLDHVAQHQGAFVGLNPLHALYPAMPESASPYSPSSRRWLNVIYIDVNAVDDFMLSESAQRWWQSPVTQQQLSAVRESEWVDYTGVMQLKLQALRLAFDTFQSRSSDDHLQQAYQQFVQVGGESLWQQAIYDALQAQLIAEDAMMWGWPVWPEKYRDGLSAEVQHFAREHVIEVQFYAWLQWLADRQLAACYALSQQKKMPLGLYRDLAVGVAEGGTETWCDRELYCLKASVGAPPDILGPLGQNWGLPPMDPHVMVQRGYQPFIDLLRSNMQHCGALRIDHVMSLLRLWWIPYGDTADRGAYVHYPVDDLLGILALESQRQQCMVIGEDLGTVPPNIIGKLRQSRVYSYKVLYFEQAHSHQFRAPEEYQVQAMATLTTHDLPTLKGYWNSADLTLGDQLGLYPDADILMGLFADRQKNQQGLLTALAQAELLPTACVSAESKPAMSHQLSQAIQCYLARCQSALLGLQPEDWLEMAEPVNVPGTTDQYPNWRRKLSVTLETMFADPQVTSLLRAINKERHHPVVPKSSHITMSVS